MNDSIIRALQRADKSLPGKFLAYVRMILRNAAFDWARKNKRKMEYLRINTNSQPSTRSAFAEAISKEALQFFDSCVKKLSRKERRVVILRVIEGLCFRDVAKKMKTSPQAARILFWRAKERLRDFLGYMKA